MMRGMFTKFSFATRLLAAFSFPICAFAAAPDDKPELQKEPDWVDARWNQTDLGNFHASVLPLPGGRIAKGLSIRVGTNGAVAYDTATCSLRGAWTGGFLKFAPGRYGLIDAPMLGGAVQFSSSAAPAWGKSIVQWRGLHVNGPRVVMEYAVDGVLVHETPWVRTQKTDETSLLHFSRELEIGPRDREINLRVLETSSPSLGVKAMGGGVYYVLHTNRQDITTVGLARGGGTKDLPELYTDKEHHLWARFAPSTKTTTCELLIWSGSSLLAPEVTEFAVDAKPANELPRLAQPGAPRWTPLTTRGQRGFGNDAYVIDTLTVPYDNPWKALFFTAGVDFLPNGDAAVCTIHGDVWLVSGVDDNLQKLTWRRFATGLFQPLGLRVRAGQIYVLGRDQITRLHDENGDGEADFYENFCNQIQTSTGGHDYVTSLDTDTNGNFYYIDPRGVHRISPDGKKHETIAAGWRNPNGMGVSADGSIITAAPQQGEWTPASSICEAKPGGWYGYAGPRVTPERPLGYDAPLCWIPHRVDNSSGSQLWVNSDRWGPLQNHFVHFSFGRCAQFLVLREVVDGVAQGAITPLPGKFLSGAMRGAFNPKDGQLYVVGSKGWQTSAARDGCLQRVRYTGATPLVPVEFNVHTNGVRVRFATELDPAAAEDAGSYAVAHWNYRYAKQYGSKDFLPSDPEKEGRETLEVRSAKLLPDGKGVFLEISGLRPVMQFELRYSLKSSAGKNMKSELHGSINKLGAKWE
jgi:hypothetical protein